MAVTLIALLSAIFAGRALWMEEYFRRYRGHYGSLKGALGKTRVQISNPNVDAQKAKDKNEYYVRVAQRQFDICLLGGAIGVTAWSALYSASGNAGFRLSGLSLGFLFLGVFILIAGPVCARAEEMFFSYSVRESAVYTGFSAVIFSLCSMAWDLTGKDWGILAALVAASLAANDLNEDWTHIKRLKRNLPKRGCQCSCCPH
ncbi:hypothetical protein [Streptomyces sp. NPDC005507]|uniref:hypothetical protein n=1 Tax=Streptomyces sp. NPDC005507 TaxID=3154885 RepID=UPI0033BD3991